MDDHEVLGRINEPGREEHELFQRESHGKVTDADRERLRRLEVTLDQCWDLASPETGAAGGGTQPGRSTRQRREDRRGIHGLIVVQQLNRALCGADSSGESAKPTPVSSQC